MGGEREESLYTPAGVRLGFRSNKPEANPSTLEDAMAGSLNKVLLIGRFGADPKLSYLPSGQPVVNVNLATDDSYKDKNSGEKVERTEWHRLVVYGKAAEVVANYTRKGSLLYIEGALRTRKWQDQSGADRWTTEIVVRDFTFLESKREADAYQQGGGYQQGGYQQGGYQGGGYQQGGPQGQQQQGGPQGQPQGQPQGGQQARGGYQMEDEDIGPAFPSEAGGMDDVPF